MKALFKQLNTWIVLLIVVLALILSIMLRNPHWFPVETVVVNGDYWHVSEQEIIALVNPEVKKGFFQASLEKIQADLKQLPWVEHVSITRQWPNTYEVMIQQKQPLAIWNHNGLITQDFSIFYPLATTFPSGLPVFSGDIAQEKTISQQYLAMNAMLNPLAPLSIVAIEVNNEQAWQIRFDNQTVVTLGDHDILGRFKRFVAIYKQLVTEKQKTPAYIDMRYSHGVAVKWALTEEEQHYGKTESQ